MSIGLQRSARRNSEGGWTDYATPEEFECLFESKRDPLLRLALLLTGSVEKAEQSLNHALRDCRLNSSVSTDWVLPWARRAIVRNAIQLVCLPASVSTAHSMNGDGTGVNSQAVPAATSLHEDISSIEKLPDFERLVLIITVLEHISIQDYALLLARSPKEVFDAQKRAIHLLASAAHSANVSFKDGAAERDTRAKQFEN
ncbi:MAG: hypothetical protein ACLPY1_16865 [Terracidiphilus sp.]